MMTIPVQSLVNCTRMNRARRRAGLRKLLALARQNPAYETLVAHALAAIELHNEASRVAADWRRARKYDNQHAPGAKEADRLVDRAVSGLHGYLETVAETWEPELAALARDLLDRLFPGGPIEYTSLPYAEEHEEVNTLLETLYGASCAEAREKLPILVLIDRLAQLNTAYGRLLVQPERLLFEQVRAADDRSYGAYVSIFARVIGLFPTDDATDLTQRSELLAPLFEQLDDFREVQARRAGDEEDDDEAETASGGASGAAAP
jgi:hypothetical protein